MKRHRWFKGIDWNDVLQRKLTVRYTSIYNPCNSCNNKKRFQPPIVPKIMYDGDSSNFDDYPESDWKSTRTLEDSELKLFEDF